MERRYLAAATLILALAATLAGCVPETVYKEGPARPVPVEIEVPQELGKGEHVIRIKGRYPCQEDEILQGTGDFTGGAGWTAYRCQHPDNV